MSHAATSYETGTDTWQAAITRVQWPALLIGLIGMGLTIVGLVITPQSAYRSYLWAFMYWAAIPLGSLVLLMIQHMTGGLWGVTMRRFLEASSWLVLLTLVFAIPLILVVVTGKHWFYPWVGDHPQFGHVVNPTHAAFKQLWLSPWFFLLRLAIYFTIWIGLSQFLYHWSGKEDKVGYSPLHSFRARQVAAPGILLYGLSMTFATIDWVMSLDPGWYSTMFGVLFLIGQALATMAFTNLVIFILSQRQPLKDILNTQLINDLGNLTFAFLMLWAYTNFSQFLIMWSGNIAEEIPYYYVRTKGSWGFIALAVVLFHFFIPFFLLIWRKVKRNMRLLAMVAIGILVVRSVDLFWIIKPMFLQREITLGPPQVEGADAKPAEVAMVEAPMAHVDAHAEHVAPHDTSDEPHTPIHPVPGLIEGGFQWTDLPAMAGLGGIWVAAFAWKLKQRPLLPPNDPRMERLLHGGDH